VTIVIEKRDYSGHVLPPFFTIRRIALITSFVIIPLVVLLYYGIEDNTAWFFGHDYINDYRYRIDGVVYNIGIMVGHFALIVTVSLVGLLIAWVVYETLKAFNIMNVARVRDHRKFQ
jgi:ABC-type multidrug transport system permease subunit